MSSTVQSLALSGDGALPTWFKPARFLDDSFDAESYVTDLRRFVPLEALSSQLQAYLKVLKGKLVEVINEDYNDFVSLSTKLVNVDGAVAQMQRPLLVLKERLTAAQAAVQSELDVLNQCLQKRQQAAKVKALLKLMQDTAHVMSKVEKLLAEVDSSATTDSKDVSPDFLDGQTRLYERVATEVSRLKYYLVKGQSLPSLQQLQPRADSAVEQLSGLLRQALGTSVSTGHQSAVLHCLHAYAVIGDTADAEQVIQEVMVAPMIQQVLVEEKAKQGPTALATVQLGPVLSVLMTRIQDRCSQLIRATLTAQSGLQAFDFLGNSILAAVNQQVADALPGAFSPGKPASFLANYAAATDFLQGLEAMCSTKAALQAFRSSPAFDSFLKRWNLAVYFSLRFQEIAGPLESKLSSQSLVLVSEEQQADSMQQLCLQPSLALWHALQRCTAQDTFLQPVADKFVRLTFQLLTRYSSWVREGLASRSATVQDPGQAEQSWAARASPEQLALVRADVDSLSSWLQAHFWPSLQRLLGFAPVQVVQQVRGSFDEATAGLQAAAEPVNQAIVAVLLDRCLTVLRQLRGITATYRMTARPLPTKPSHYVAGVLQPLRAFLDSAKALNGPAQKELTQALVGNVCLQYASMVSELLDMLHKTEQSLAKVRRNKVTDVTATAGASEVSNIQKISMQLLLDIKEFGVQIGRSGLVADDLPEYQQLLNTVQADTQIVEQ